MRQQLRRPKELSSRSTLTLDESYSLCIPRFVYPENGNRRSSYK